MSWSVFKDVATTLLASLGAILGVFNTVQAERRKRVKLTVVAKSAFAVSPNPDFSNISASIEVVNLSEFPVYIAEAGFEIIGSDSRYSLNSLLTADNLSFTRRLDSRQSVTGYFDRDGLKRGGVAGRCFVRTESGERFVGNMLKG